MAKERISIQHGKKDNEIDATKRVIQTHLSANKETLARIQCERVLRERTQVEAFDVVETFIELLANSNTVFSDQRDFDTASTDIKESVASVVYASSRLNIPELRNVKNMFRNHFGAAVIDPLTRLEGPHTQHINKVVARTLEGGPPDGYLVLQELEKIAKEGNISWMPPPEYGDLDPSGGHGYYRPSPLAKPHFVPGMPNYPSAPPSAPPSDDYGGSSGGGGGGGMMNIPGHNPYPGAGYGIPGMGPSGPAPTAPPPFDPSSGAAGTFYPPPAGPGGGYGGHGAAPPPPAAPAFLNDDALEQRFRNVKDSRK